MFLGLLAVVVFISGISWLILPPKRSRKNAFKHPT